MPLVWQADGIIDHTQTRHTLACRFVFNTVHRIRFTFGAPELIEQIGDRRLTVWSVTKAEKQAYY